MAIVGGIFVSGGMGRAGAEPWPPHGLRPAIAGFGSHAEGAMCLAVPITALPDAPRQPVELARTGGAHGHVRGAGSNHRDVGGLHRNSRVVGPDVDVAAI